jgi:hypothetical protein
MDLYVCYGTAGTAKRHPCAKAYRALSGAGHRPRVIRTYGCYGTDRFLRGRRAIKHLTGNYNVPTSCSTTARWLTVQRASLPGPRRTRSEVIRP